MRRSAVAYVVPLLTVLGLACTSPQPEGEESAAPAGDPPVQTAGCGAEPPIGPGGSVTLSMRVGELDREYRVHLPAGYDPDAPVSLLLDFHGYTGGAESEEEYTGLSDLADQRGFVVVYPQGTAFEGPDGASITSWNDLAGSRPSGPEGPICSQTAFEYPHPPECGEPTPCTWATCHDDLAFVEALLDRLEATLCVDKERVFATGMSNGGMFVHRLGCDLADRFAAIAPVGGTMARGYNCAPQTPLSMMNVYGRNDDYVSQKGVMSSDGYYYLGAAAVLDEWAAAQGCAAEATPYPTSRSGDLGLECVERADCATGAEVVHCEWEGGHDWPAAEGQAVGNEIIWEFFARNARQ